MHMVNRLRKMGWGKTQPVLNYPVQKTHKTISCLLGGGEKLGRPITLTRLNIMLVQKVIRWGKTVVEMVNHLQKTQPTLPVINTHVTFACYGVGEKLGRPILSPPRQG